MRSERERGQGDDPPADDARVFVVGRFPPPADGQANMTELCARLLAAGRRVARINTQPSRNPVRATPTFSPSRALHFVWQRGRLRRALHADPTASVLWHSISPAALGHWRDLLVTVPSFHPRQQVAAVLHRAGFEQLFAQRITRPTARRLVQRVRYFVFQSEHLARPCTPWLSKEQIRIIPNTVAPGLVPTAAELMEKRRSRADRRDGWHLLYLSHMMPEKGYETVLEAFALLRSEGLDARATFAGSWPNAASRAEFMVRAQILGVADRIAMPGPVLYRHEVRQLHLSADLLCLPTYHPTETQPVVVLEALAAGTPVIVTEREAFTDMLGRQPRAGALVPPQDAKALANAARRLLDLRAWLDASEAAEARFAGRFGPVRVGMLWNDLVQELQHASPKMPR